MAEEMKSLQKDISHGHRYKATENNFNKIISYNSKSDFNKKVKFVDIDLSYNK